MIKMSLITLFTLVCICIAVYAIWTVRVSRQSSNKLLNEFRKIDNSLRKSNDSLQKISTGAFKRDSFRLPQVELAIKANTISRCIDSIKHDLVLLTNQKASTEFTYPDKPRLLALKNNLADYNSFIQKYFSGRSNIKSGDFVNIADVQKRASFIPWEIYYFKNSTVFFIITELTFINTQVLKLQQKATK
jgi:hypothetical protein